MNIIIFLENTARGGVDTFIQALIQNWPSKRDNFKVIVNSCHPGKRYLKENLSNFSEIVDYDGLFPSAVMRYSSTSLFRKFCWKAVSYYCFLLHLLRIKKKLGKEEYDVLFVVTGAYPGGDSCRAAALVGKNVFFNIHNFAANISLPFYLIEKLIDQLIILKSRAIITVSNSCKKSLEKRLKSKKITYVFNGIQAPDDFTFNTMTKESINCSVVGSFSDRKGQANFLNVVKSLKTLSPAIRFHFYGEDEVQGSGNKKAFLDKVESEGLNDVVMAHGFESKSEIYKNTDILCVPSLWDESFGLVCIEAMSRKIPVVATRVGGLPEVVEDGVCGYIVDGYNYTDFSNKILSLAVSPEKRRLMGEKGRERFEQLFKAERMCSDYDQIIKDLL